MSTNNVRRKAAPRFVIEADVGNRRPSLVDREKNACGARIDLRMKFKGAIILGISNHQLYAALPLARSAHIRHTLLF
jgi:hypothetical protein